jgi:hypothetical protein
MFIPLGLIIVVALLWVAYRYRWNNTLTGKQNEQSKSSTKRIRPVAWVS